jgi:predicted  nucleic acid-binding Zn-ribbon protein
MWEEVMTDAELIAWMRSLKGLGWSNEAADSIEALTEQLTAARQDAKEAEAYAEELGREQKGWQEASVKLMNKLTTSEAKLAKALEALESLIQQTHDCEKELTEDLHHVDFCGESEPLTKARATLAEIKGDSHD